jgi:hypothetical protein
MAPLKKKRRTEKGKKNGITVEHKMCVTSFFSMTQKNIFPIKCPVTI